ncbi:leucine-rich repeat receptor-like kinase protein SUNN [Lycium barbarum]|uniref:leucine-rich repeat receptor-like kinase protein SUNN n=1 Tax=Lycium barbarum TaxID=112863 RepID=UPI00293E91E3|nr:leucine-rich repeat receptor-like kinase protein SUNN [Lycium barbarum]
MFPQINSMERKQNLDFMIIFFAIFLLIHVNNSETIAIKEDEMKILLELKECWGNNSSDIFQMWNLNYSPCSNWPGITCSSDGFVTRISLRNQKLGGNIVPPIICELKNLVDVALADSNFSGEFPTVFYKCSRLEILDLSGNQFYGPLPTDIHRMSRLTFLDLIANRFNGTIPKSIAQLTKLKHLSLSKNMFEGKIPPEIGNLSNLEVLGMSYMKKFEFATIPNELGKLKNLKVLLIIQSNLIGNIPESFSSLSRLKTLDLSRNYLNGSIPGWLLHLKSLTKIDLSWNRLSGKIPSQLDEDFDYDFDGNFDLCTSNTSHASKYLPLCTNHKPCRTLILGPLVGTILVIVIVFLFLCWRKRQGIGDRRFIPFQKTELTESDILLNLTDENFIGRGGCGDVYRIAVHQNGSHVAVKRIRKERELDSRLEKQFLAELQILSEIQHPNIVKLICCFSNEDSNFLVYEYMENQSLDKWLHEKKRNKSQNVVLKWDTRLHIAVGAARGLCYMHHNCFPPIIHRDIKSSNILLDNEWNAKVADFGLAKVLAKQEDSETASAVAGTFGYIAPEYAYATKVSTKSDVYSFGVILLELATGKEPVNKDDYMNLAQWARKQCVDGNIIEDALDEEIKGLNNLKAMTTLFKLGMMCTSKLASIRPSMREVLEALLFLATSY